MPLLDPDSNRVAPDVVQAAAEHRIASRVADLTSRGRNWDPTVAIKIVGSTSYLTDSEFDVLTKAADRFGMGGTPPSNPPQGFWGRFGNRVNELLSRPGEFLTGENIYGEKPSATLTGAVGAVAKSAEESLSTVGHPVGAVIPSDIRTGAKTAFEDIKAHALGGQSPLDLPGQQTQGVLPTITTGVQAVERAAGVPVRYAQAGTQQLVADLNDAVAKLDPTNFFKPGTHPDVPSLQRSIQDAKQMTLGEQIATQQGFKRGSDPFNTLSATANMVADTIVFGGIGKVAKGIELAGEIPKAAQAAKYGLTSGEALGLKGIERGIYDFLAKSPEQLVYDTPQGQRTVASLQRLGTEGNLSWITGLYPEFAQKGLNGKSLAEELVASPGQADELMVAAMHGELTPMSRFAAEARLRQIANEQGQIVGAKMTREDFIAAARTAEDLPQSSLQHMTGALQKPEGAPGLSLEQAYSEGADVPGLKEVVWRDETGTPRGILEFSLDEKGHVASATASVDPAYRGQHIGAQMVLHAEQQGYGVEAQIMGEEALSTKGAAAVHRVAVERYGQMDQAVAQKTIDGLDSEKRALEQVLTDNRGQFVLRNLPSADLGAQIKDFVSRLPATEEATTFRKMAQVFDKTWPRRFTQILPEHEGIPVFDKPAGIREMRAWGENLKLPRTEIDAAVNRYITTTSQGEVSDIINDLLKKADLPERTKSQQTQRVENGVAANYGVSHGGKDIDEWAHEVAGEPGKESVLYHQPIYESQLATRVPVPDPRSILENGLMKNRYREAVLDWAKTKGSTGTLVKAVAVKPLDAYMATSRMTHTAMSMFWKPSVLLRLGWPVKVVALDEQARLAANGIPSLWYRPWENMAIESLFKTPVKLFKGQVDLAAPEDVLVNWGRNHLMQTPRQSLLAQGNRGFGEAMQQELLQGTSSQTVRQILRTDAEQTKIWLRQTEAGRAVAEDMRPIFEKLGKTSDDWVDLLQKRIDTIAPTPELKRALQLGKIDRGDGVMVPLSSPAAAEVLQNLPASDVPAVVRDLRPLFAREGVGGARRFVDQLMNYFGNAPTNYLSRSQAFRSFYERDLQGLLARGVDHGLAEKAARQWSIDTTNELLYNIGQKTAFDALHEQLVPFFPAWKEVLKVWSTQIPEALGGPVFGHISLLGRAKAIYDFGKAFNLIQKDPVTGQDLLSLGGLQIPLTRLAMFGTTPGFGPVPTAALSMASKQSKAVENFLKPLQQYGPEFSLGPQILNRTYLSVFKHPAPWEVFSARYQQAQWDLSYLRNMQKNYPELKRRLKAGEDQQTVIDDIMHRAEGQTTKEFVWRAVTGFVLPAAPLRIAADEQQLAVLRNQAAGVTGSEGEAERKALYERFRQEHPELAGYLVSRSFRTQGEQKLEQGREAWWRDWRNGNVKIYQPDEFGKVLAGFAEYDLIRTDQREKINQAGTTAGERLKNYYQVQQASLDAAYKQEVLKQQNPEWAQAWDRILTNAAERKGKTAPDAAEQKVLELHRLLRILPLLVNGQENEIDFKQVRQVTAQIGAVTREYGVYSSAAEIPAGPDQDVASWFEKVFNPYMDTLNQKYKGLETAKTAEDVSAVMDDVRRYKDSQAPQTLNGEALPTPEEVLYNMNSEADKTAKRQAWAMNRSAWLTGFQRKTLGLADTEKARTFWDQVNAADKAYRTFTSTTSPSSKLAQDYKATLDSWKRSEASRLGLMSDYVLSTQAPYARLMQFGLVKGDTWSKVAYVDTQAQRTLQADGVGWGSKEGQSYAQTFFQWLDDYRKVDPTFSDDLDALKSVAPTKVQRPLQKFYTYVFLTGSVF